MKLEIIANIKYQLDIAHSMDSSKKTIKKLNKQLQKEKRK
jgi:hypothetical protein